MGVSEYRQTHRQTEGATLAPHVALALLLPHALILCAAAVCPTGRTRTSSRQTHPRMKRTRMITRKRRKRKRRGGRRMRGTAGGIGLMVRMFKVAEGKAMID